MSLLGRSKFTPEIVAEMRHLHDNRGWSWARIGRRYGTSNVHARRVALNYGKVNTDCPEPVCFFQGPHDHCVACSLPLEQGPICPQCENEAHRAILRAIGQPRLAEQLGDVNPDVVIRVLRFQERVA